MQMASPHLESEIERLVGEQEALRRVATFVARGVPPEEVFGAVAAEVSVLFGSDVSALLRFESDGTATVLSDIGGPHEAGARVTLDPGYVVDRVRETRRSARFDAADTPASNEGTLVRMIGVHSAVASPIVVEGALWGAITVASVSGPLSPPAERQLTEFTELVATAIANAGARRELARLAEEQAALRRVAELVARDSSSARVFQAVTAEAGRVLETEAVGLLRFESNDTATLVAQSETPWDPPPLGTQLTLDGENVVTAVAHTGQCARADDWAGATGAVSAMATVLGVRSIVATPIVVERRLWGTLIAATSQSDPLPADTERRVQQFAELVATAIANAEARTELSRLAEEQAALRHLAELVAREAPPTAVFSAATDAIGALLAREPRMVRYDGDDSAVVVAAYSASRHPEVLSVGARLPLGGNNAISGVFRTGEPVRIDDYRHADGAIADAVRPSNMQSVVATPIIVRGRPWGAMLVASFDDEKPLSSETECRLWQFTELIATAIANAEARDEIERLADEQAALRRVATLVAEGASPDELFDAVALEIERLLAADFVSLTRSGSDDRTRAVVESETGLPPAAAAGASVEVPIVVQGRRWGVATATWTTPRTPPADTEQRMAQFAQLLGTAIANADSLDQLRASRARLVTAGDAARRRVVRDLHDGAQQRLVHAIITLRLALDVVRDDPEKGRSLVARAIDHAEQGHAELRELAHGILPSVLTNGGLGAAVGDLVERLELPVRVEVPSERFPPEVEASAYFIVAEALTNVTKHSRASTAEVTAYASDGSLYVEVCDDGVGGADRKGHGLVGLADRATALGGRLDIESTAPSGTRVAATLPLNGGCETSDTA